MEATPDKKPAAHTPPSVPGAQCKPPQRHVAWADMVDSMDTMPAQEATKLAPSDIGVTFGPVMDEHQFAEYQKARRAKGKNVRILK